MKKKIIFLIIPLALSFISCGAPPIKADLIVYGDNIYTSNANNEFVEAFAVKDGKFIAVGNKEDIDKFKGNDTVIYDEKFVMPGGIESHGHWILEEAFKLGFYISPYKTDHSNKNFDDILNDISEYSRNHPELDRIYGYGFDVSENGLPDLKKFDEVFPNIAVFISECSLHGAYVNSKCFELAGVLDEDKDGIVIDRIDGKVMGFARDEACSYIIRKVFDNLFTTEQLETAVTNATHNLNKNGYVVHYDTWSNFDGSDNMYKAIHNLDTSGNLNFLFSSAYCIESFEKDKIDSMINKTLTLKNTYTSAHYKPSMLKLFADGIVETGTGFIIDSYNTGPDDHGTQIWDNATMTSIVNKANKVGIPVHIHTMGDAACKEAVDAFVDSYNNNGYIRNSIGHVALIRPEEISRISQYNFALSSGANWASQISNDDITMSRPFINESTLRSLYPFKEYIDAGVKAALHTDNPCSPGILDIFGYIQVMLNGWDHSKDMSAKMFPRRNSGFVSIKDAINMFTINGAWMNNLENERGSIEVGKYADFIFGSADPFATNIDDVWQVKVTKTFFEGNEVYKKPN